ncbi:acyl-CoA dehydrogenase family protein [Iodidimonas sp. SYSU 1G8]|uniref:acyl-CoA dehydrogenase family protein n=1 Tax=Iodidimonas sp. SYSU 1G8 TaxID=3133967 RepID=UPI0031FE95B0
MIRNPEAFDHFLSHVREWVRGYAIPNEERVAQGEFMPKDISQEMARQGFFGWSIPEEYGGAGLTAEELVLGALEISQCSVAFRAHVGTNTGIGSEALVVDGTPEQKRRYLPKMARGELIGCLAATEPEAGSDLTALQTTARRDGEHYVLNGTKAFITNAPVADLFTVMARTEEGTKGAGGVSAFIVERESPGLSTGKPYRKMGQEGAPVSEVYFEDCRIPASALIGGVENVGFKTTMKVLNKQRLHLSALSTGPAIRMLDEAVRHALTRKQFGQAIGEFQLVQGLIADCQTEIHAAKALILDTARKRDRGEDTSMEASMSKYFATEMCGRVADRAVQIFGGSGYIADYSCIERFYRDVRPFRLYEGTSQIHQTTIARMTMKRAMAQ